MSLNSDIIRYEEINDFSAEEETDPNRSRTPQTVHDWEAYRMSNVFDDGTESYFWSVNRFAGH